MKLKKIWIFNELWTKNAALCQTGRLFQTFAKVTTPRMSKIWDFHSTYDFFFHLLIKFSVFFHSITSTDNFAIPNCCKMFTTVHQTYVQIDICTIYSQPSAESFFITNPCSPRSGNPSRTTMTQVFSHRPCHSLGRLMNKHARKETKFVTIEKNVHFPFDISVWQLVV